MSFEQEKMIVGSPPSLYPLQKFEEEAINALVSLPIDDDTISRAKAIEALDKRFDSIPMEQTSEILMLRKDLRELPPAQLGANLAEVGTDCISRQAAIDAVNCVMVMKGIRSWKSIVSETVESAKRIMTDNIRDLPPVQPLNQDSIETQSSDPSQIAAQIIHDAIDNTAFAEEEYPGVKEQLHRSVEEWEKLQTVFCEIAEEYQKAVSMTWINKPIAKALYEVWKRYDRNEKKRGRQRDAQ